MPPVDTVRPGLYSSLIVCGDVETLVCAQLDNLVHHGPYEGLVQAACQPWKEGKQQFGLPLYSFAYLAKEAVHSPEVAPCIPRVFGALK